MSKEESWLRIFEAIAPTVQSIETAIERTNAAYAAFWKKVS